MMEPSQARRVLRQHVDTDRLLGVESVPLGQPQPGAARAEPVSVTPAAAPGPKSPAPPVALPPPGGTPLWAAAPLTPAPRLGTGQKIEALHAMDEQEVRV